MGRPRTPLIDPAEAIAKALEIIDRDGAEALSIRKLGAELGVNGASLYHHFKDKEAILQGVRRLVLNETGALLRASKNATWQDYVTRSIGRYRAALLRHPNTAPLMVPTKMSDTSQVSRNFLVSKMLTADVPVQFVFAIIDSVETLAFGSALINPLQLNPVERSAMGEETPLLNLAVKSAHRTADRLFRLQLEALLAGWAVHIQQARSAT